MEKLSREVLEKLLGENACVNELVVLPVNCESGFEEYFSYKVKAVIEQKSLFTPEEENRLLLTFPKPDAREPRVFDRFFDSPSIVARNREFEGCFGIDISHYIGKMDDERFEQLMTYIHGNTEAVYVLILFSDNKNEIAAVCDCIRDYGEYRVVNIPAPEPAVLAEYTLEGIRTFVMHIRKGVQEQLEAYYGSKGLGYDFADRLVQCLKQQNYEGNTAGMQQALEQVEKEMKLPGTSSGYGY